jgi:hypothetical protein
VSAPLDSTVIPCSDAKNLPSIVPVTTRPWHDQISLQIHSFRSIANPKSLVFLRIQARDLAKAEAEEQVVVLDAVVEVEVNLAGVIQSEVMMITSTFGS